MKMEGVYASILISTFYALVDTVRCGLVEEAHEQTTRQQQRRFTEVDYGLRNTRIKLFH